ncbi:hypothetical protein BGX29_007908, partial [Mortierella sp. GBA35]
MHLSAKAALIEARPHIDAARQARSTKDIIKQYQDAKNILAKVDAKKEDIQSLKEMIDAFHELAAVLDNAGPATQDKAKKCRRRAAALMQDPNRINTITAAVAVSLHGVPQIAVSSLSKSTATTVAVANNSAATSPSTSTENVVSPATFASQQKPRSTPQTLVSLSAAKKTQLLFSKKADRAPFVYHLPAPGEQLQTTLQLVYCLALLQESVDETLLDPATLEWRRSTLDNSVERRRLVALAGDIITAFFKDPLKHAVIVAEVIQVAPMLDKESFRSLLDILVGTVVSPGLLATQSVDGLAKVIQGAPTSSIDPADLVDILAILHNRLRTIHEQSPSRRCLLLFTISQVLVAMADADVGDVDTNLHRPLTVLLQESESCEDPYLAFQVAYTIQALLNVSDNESIWQAGARRGWLVVKGAAGFAKVSNPTEVKDALEGLESLHAAGNGGMHLLKNALEAIKNNEKPTFTVKEGLKFKRAWYQALRSAEKLLQGGELKSFKELVIDAVCRHQLNFQMGICQLLGRFAVDTQWDLESRRSTVAFLGALCQADDVWNREKGIEQVILDMISILAINHGTHFEAAKTLQEKLQQQNSALTPLTDL